MSPTRNRMACFGLCFILFMAGSTPATPGDAAAPAAGRGACREPGTAQEEEAAVGGSVTKIAVIGGEVAAGTSAKLDLFHDCFQYGTTEANRVRASQAWWSILGRILSDWVDGAVHVTNAGAEGETAARWEAGLEESVLSHSPDYVLVLFGTEDALAGVEPGAFRKNLEKIVDAIREREAVPVLLTPAPISERMTAGGCTNAEMRRQQARLSGLAQAVSALAEERSIALIDLHRFFLDNRLAYDHLYEGRLPDAVAQTAMASFVAGKLLPLMGVDRYPEPILCDYRKIYTDAGRPATKHNAFTDIAFFKGAFFVAFRKAHGHANPKHSDSGSDAIAVMRSVDGVTWVEDAVLKKEGRDNRDPKFLQVDGRLIVYAPCTRIADQPDGPRVVTYGFERLGPGKWSEPFGCAPCVFWRPCAWRGQYVVAAYLWEKKDAAVKLLSSEDGREWKEISSILPLETEGNETDLHVNDGRLTAYSRAASNLPMLISSYIPAENRWEIVSSGRIIHAPNVFMAKGRLMICGRYCSYSDRRFKELQKDWRIFTQGGAEQAEKVDPARVEEYHHGLRTGLFLMDGNRPRLLMELLSAGDSSYTGVVQYGDEYVFSDYSMHEHYAAIRRPGDWNTPSDIYVWRIRFGR